jgi:hypothetical protein
VARLPKLGAKVRVADNLSRGSMENLHDCISQIDFMRLDLTESDSCESATQTQQSKGIPLKGRTRILWFVIGAACWFAFTVYSQFDLAVSLITAPAIVFTLFIAQRGQSTLEGSSINAERWMFRLWWVGTFFVALGFSLLYISLFYGLLVLGIPFLILDVFLTVRGRQRIPEISATTPNKQ